MKKVRLRRYHAPAYDEPIIMEMGRKGQRGIIPPRADAKIAEMLGPAERLVPGKMLRTEPPALPEIDQYHCLSHFLRLSQMTLGMETGTDISEGTCTMKYSPKMHEQLVRLPQVTEVHPLQPEDTIQGILEIAWELRGFLNEISGMSEFSFQTGGGAHATYLNACVVRRYHESRGELDRRTEMITTQFTHPCNAATPATAGFKVIILPHRNGYPDLEALKAAVSYTHLRAHETVLDHVCRLLLEKKKK